MKATEAAKIANKNKHKLKREKPTKQQDDRERARAYFSQYMKSDVRPKIREAASEGKTQVSIKLLQWVDESVLNEFMSMLKHLAVERLKRDGYVVNYECQEHKPYGSEPNHSVYDHIIHISWDK